MSDYPLIKYVLVFIFGIILQSILGLPLISSIIVLSGFLFVLLILLFVKNEKLFKPRIIFSLIVVFVFGAAHYTIFKNDRVKYPFELPLNKNVVAYGKVTEVNLIRFDRVIFYFETDSVKLQNETVKEKIKLLCTVKDSKKRLKDFYSEVKIGNELSIVGSIARARDNRNPGEFDYEAYITENGIHGLMIIYKVRDINIRSNNTDALPQLVFNIRKSIDDVVNELHNKSTTALIRGLVLADRSMIDYEIKNEFINAGVIHVLAVSGLHVGFIALIFIFLFKRFNPYLRYGFTIIGLLLFLVITNSPTSVVRATIMAVVMILSPLTGRNYNSINALALAALIILLFSPGELFNPGFQLSFSAVLSIVIFYPPLSRTIHNSKIKSNFLKYILLFCAVSMAAQIGTLPFTLVYFHRLSIIALLANIVVIPLIGFVVGLGILTIVISSFVTWFGSVFASANELLAYFLFSFVRLLGKSEYSFISIQQFSIFDSIIFYGAITFLFFYWGKVSHWFVKATVIVSIILILFIGIRLDNRELLPPNELSVLTIDIGQGDAILIRFPNGKTALIDAGDATEYFDNGERVIIPLLNYLGIEKVDYGFISHVDADHYRGILSLIKNQRIAQIYKSKIDTTENKDVELEHFIRSHKIFIKYYGKNYLNFEQARLYILNDTLSGYFQSMSTNDRSGMFKVVFGETSFLFTGDAGLRAEKYYIENYGSFLKSNILKAGHHGSKTSTGEEFLKIVDPDYAIISSGILNKFKHPHTETIERLTNNDVEIFRTDKQGAILFRSDGRTVKNINWKKLESEFIF